MRRLFPLLLLVVAVEAPAARPPAAVPRDPDAVLLVLPRAAPDARPEVLLAEAARRGDARLVDRAQALLARAPTADDELARAWIAQHRHDFAAALALLDARLATRPRDAAARELRAQVLLTTGALRRAAADCAALALAGDAARGLLCTARLQHARGRHAEGAALVRRWLERAPADDPRRAAALVLLAELRAADDPAAAEVLWREALALDPQDVRTLASVARGLRAGGRAALALDLLPRDPPTATLRLERALAAQAAGETAERERLRALLAREAALRAATGAEPEARDEALRLLHLEGEPAAALAVARANFARQREPEDAALLVAAAAAAGDPGAAAEVAAWRRAEGVVEAQP